MKTHSKKKTKTKSTTPKARVVQELAKHFEEDLNRTLPISIQPDGSIVYKGYVIKQSKTGNWGLFNLHSMDKIDEFYLKTSALMAAKRYSTTQFEKFFEIKSLDSRYWANYVDSQVYGHNVKTAKDFDKYQVLVTRYEHSKFLAEHYKDKISTMFRWSFV
jgi:hypothetical protein